eukprot:6196585-Pleurochrysis_carterae.AAC.1
MLFAATSSHVNIARVERSCHVSVERTPKRSAPKQTAALWATQRRFRSRQWMHVAHSSSQVWPTERENVP